MSEWLPIVAIVLGVMALIASIAALVLRPGLQAVQDEVATTIGKTQAQEARMRTELQILTGRLRDVEDKCMHLRKSLDEQARAFARDSAPAAPMASLIRPPYGVGFGNPAVPVLPYGATRITDAIAAMRLLIEKPGYDARDKFVAEFGLRSLDANLAETSGEGIYWLMCVDGDGPDALFPGWPVIKDWHMVYRGPDKVFARQQLERCFDIGEGDVLRIIEPARVSPMNPADIVERGHLEGA